MVSPVLLHLLQDGGCHHLQDEQVGHQLPAALWLPGGCVRQSLGPNREGLAAVVLGILSVVIQPCAVSSGHPSEEAQGLSSSSLAHSEQSPHSWLCFGTPFSHHHHTKWCLQHSSTFPYSCLCRAPPL